jgi:hypothetical protein
MSFGMPQTVNKYLSSDDIMIEKHVEKQATRPNFPLLKNLARHGSERLIGYLRDAALSAGMVGISVAAAFGQSNADQQPVQINRANRVMYSNIIEYSALLKNGAYFLSAATDNNHCYMAGIRITDAKAELFIRVVDHYIGPYPYPCYTPSLQSTVPIKDDESIKKTMGTTINIGAVLRASIAIADGLVNLYAANGDDKISFEVKDPAKSLDTRGLNEPANQTVNAESSQWIVRKPRAP